MFIYSMSYIYYFFNYYYILLVSRVLENQVLASKIDSHCSKVGSLYLVDFSFKDRCIFVSDVCAIA